MANQKEQTEKEKQTVLFDVASVMIIISTGALPMPVEKNREQE